MELMLLTASTAAAAPPEPSSKDEQAIRAVVASFTAAYNRGEGGLGREMLYSHSPDFDSLSGRKALPSETREYVQAILRNREMYRALYPVR